MSFLNLIVVAHPDDEILGIGATGTKLVSRGEEVQALILSGKVEARESKPSKKELISDIHKANNFLGFNRPTVGDFPNIRMNNVDHIDLVKFIEDAIEELNPHRIFTHHPFDLNDDHYHVSKACLAASRFFQRKSEKSNFLSLHYMEIQSSTDWSYQGSGLSFSPNLYVEIDDFLENKIQALNLYKGVMREFPHPRSHEAIKGLAAYRGGQSGQSYSEAFQTVFSKEI